MSSGKTKGLVLGVIALFTLVTFGGKLLGKNDFGNYQVIQSVSGDISVKNDFGYYSQKFADVTTYKTSDIVFFSKAKIDGGDGEISAPVEVRFSDGSTGLVSGILKYRIPTNVEFQKLIHRDFGGNERGLKNLVRQTALEALMQTASMIKAEDAYSTKRSEFKAIAHRQIKDGILQTRSVERTSTDAQGRVSIERIAELVTDENGNYVIETPSTLKTYGVIIVDFKVKDIDFDAKVDELIAKKKEAEQAKVVAKAQAEEAKQNAITEKEKGKARVAKAKADQEVEKITAVTKAEKNKAVAKLNAEQKYLVSKLDRKVADENAKALLVVKRAEAKANELLVKAGLTPRERAEFDMKTKIGVAGQMNDFAKGVKMIVGGGSGKGGVSPIDMIGLNQLLDLNDRIGKTRKK